MSSVEGEVCVLACGALVRLFASPDGRCLLAQLLARSGDELLESGPPLALSPGALLASGLVRGVLGRLEAHAALLDSSQALPRLLLGSLAVAGGALAWRLLASAELAAGGAEAAQVQLTHGPHLVFALSGSLLALGPEEPGCSHLVARPLAHSPPFALAALALPGRPLLLCAAWGLGSAPGPAALLRLELDAGPELFLVPLRELQAGSPWSASRADWERWLRAAAALAPRAQRAVAAAALDGGRLALALQSPSGQMTLLRLRRGAEECRTPLEAAGGDGGGGARLLPLPRPVEEEEGGEWSDDEEDADEEGLPPPPPLLLLTPSVWGAGLEMDAHLLRGPEMCPISPGPIAQGLRQALPLPAAGAALLLWRDGAAPPDEECPGSMFAMRRLQGALGDARLLSLCEQAEKRGEAGGEGAAALAAALMSRVEEEEAEAAEAAAAVAAKRRLLQRGRELLDRLAPAPPATATALRARFAHGVLRVSAEGVGGAGRTLALLPRGGGGELGGVAARVPPPALAAAVGASALVGARRLSVLLLDGESAPTQLREIDIPWAAVAAADEDDDEPPHALRLTLRAADEAALAALPRALCARLRLQPADAGGGGGGGGGLLLRPRADHPFLPPHARLTLRVPRGGRCEVEARAWDEEGLGLLVAALRGAAGELGARCEAAGGGGAALEAARVLAEAMAAELEGGGAALLQADTDAACAAMLLSQSGA